VSNSGGVGVGHMGPITRVVTQLSGYLAAQGHDVTIADAFNQRARDRLPSNVNLVESANRSASDIFANFAGRSLSGLRRELQNSENQIVAFLKESDFSQYDLVHIHEPRLAAKICKASHVPCVFSCHTPNEWIALERYDSSRGKLRLLLLKLHEYIGHSDLAVMRRCATTVVLGSHVTSAVEQLSPSVTPKLHIVPNGMDMREWRRLDQHVARGELHENQCSFRLVTIARLMPDKGIDVLLKAVRILNDKIKNLHVDVIGDVPAQADTAYRDSLRRESASLPVDWHGFISNQSRDYQQLLAAADLGVVPSLRDNQPTVVLEMLACGIPVVGSNLSGIPSMVSRQVGRLFPPGDHQALADVIYELHQQPGEIADMRDRSRDHVESHFSWDAIAAKYSRVFEQVLNSRRH